MIVRNEELNPLFLVKGCIRYLYINGHPYYSSQKESEDCLNPGIDERLKILDSAQYYYSAFRYAD